MRILWGLCVLLLSVTVSAQESRLKLLPEEPVSLLGVYALNYEMRFERGNSQDLEMRQPQNFALGYHLNKYSLLVEYSRFNETTGNVTSSVERRHQEMTLWGQYHVLTGTDGNMRGHAYVAAGVGGYEQEVITAFMGESRSDKSGMKVMGGAAVGLQVFILTQSQFGFSLGAEGRALMGSDFDPNPTLSGVLRVGFIAPL